MTQPFARGEAFGARGVPNAPDTRAERAVGRTIDYEHAGTALRGYFAAPAEGGQRPGVFVVHTWMGVTDGIRARADRLATEGFAAFALDVFGEGATHRPPETARAVVTPYVEDQALLRGRLRAGIAELKRQPEADPSRIGGLGYCFGGFCVLELARDGESFQAGIALHAELATRTPMRPGGVVPHLLILQGDADSVSPGPAISAFLGEMREAGADWELNLYAGARHSFTGEGAWGDALPEARLDPYADTRSWRAGVDFMRMALEPGTGPVTVNRS